MTSGITKSLEKVEFARDILKGRIVRGSFETGEYYSQKNVIVRDKNRKDRGIRQEFKRRGYAPSMSGYTGEKIQRETIQEENCNRKSKRRYFGISKSLEKVEFARDILKGRIVRGSFETGEYYSQKNVIVRDKNRKDRGIRQAFKRSGFAPSVHGRLDGRDSPKQLIKKR